MPLDDLWYLAAEAEQPAQRARQALRERHDDYLRITHEHAVDRDRFRTLASRIRAHGAPYGAHAILYRPSGDLLLARDEVVDQWVLPGGMARHGEGLAAAARREIAEEVGIHVDLDDLAILSRVEVHWNDHDVWGVLPIYAAEVTDADPVVDDPDGEITAARWFRELPADARDREHLRAWRARALDSRGAEPSVPEDSRS